MCRPTNYEQALASLGDDPRQRVETALGEWLPDPRLAQVSLNIALETALTPTQFARLLDAFANELASGKASLDSWQSTCRAHKKEGHLIPDRMCPATLGRAKGLEDHAKAIERASMASADSTAAPLTSKEAKRLLLKYSGSSRLIGFERYLREAPLGKYNLVWATFDSTNPNANPFDRLPSTHIGICTALGLGGPDSLVILVWNHADSGSPALHRPTIADAEDYPHYRPNPDASALWGLTAPLSPNPDDLQPQPEVVMPEPTSRGLRLPFRVVSA